MPAPRKLQPYQVELIFQMRREGFQRRFLEQLFGISSSALSNLLSGSTYKDVQASWRARHSIRDFS